MSLSFIKSSRVFLIYVLASLLCMQGALAHTYFSSIYLGDEALAAGDCMRPHPTTAYDSPIPLVSQADMTCGWLPSANQPANRKCPIAAGGKIGLQWYHQSPSATDDIVDPTHAGPLIVYLAKSESGSGNVWFKIYEDGYTNGVWATDKLIANRGRVDITLPSDIAPGNYLLRGEILALHGANVLNGVQPYVGCAELTISGSGSAAPAGVALPGAYKNTDAGMLFDRYGAFTSYPIPGPAVYTSGSSSSSSSSGSSTKPTTTPVSASTTRPTSAPSTPTSAPSNPTSAPSGNSAAVGNIKVGLNGGTGVWWVGAIVSGGAETVVKVEMMDSGSLKSYAAMKDEGYAYTYTYGVQFVLPISLRVTSSSGKQVILTNVFTSFSTGASLIDTGKSFSSGTTTPATAAPTVKPTSAPATSAPTNKPSTPVTAAPTSAPSTGVNAKVTLQNGASQWWLALSVNSADVSTVEIKDSGAYSTYRAMAANADWGSQIVYSFATTGTPMTVPLSVKVTSKSGKVATATISSISSNAVIEAAGSL